MKVDNEMRHGRVVSVLFVCVEVPSQTCPSPYISILILDELSLYLIHKVKVPLTCYQMFQFSNNEAYEKGLKDKKQ